MSPEVYTEIGMRLSPWNWVFALILFLTIPLSKRLLGRIAPISVIAFLAALRAGCLPYPLFMFMDILLLIAALIWILPRAKTAGFTSIHASLLIPVTPLFVLIPFLGLSFKRVFPRVTLQGDTLQFETEKGPISLRRQDLDITFEKAWSGSGFYWGFKDDREGYGVVETDAVYWSSDHRFIEGDELARHIADWSGSEPRLIFNGQPRSYKARHPTAQPVGSASQPKL